MGDVPRAIEYYTAALRIDPQLVDVLQNLGDLLLTQGAVGLLQAQTYFYEALRINPQYARAWRGLGDVMRESAEHAKAVTFYSQVPFWACTCACCVPDCTGRAILSACDQWAL
jgi:tetratricopeptide (TPR) repeat protein